MLQLPIYYYVSLITVTITRHLFIGFFQMKHFSAVKFYRGYEKNTSFLVIPKSPNDEKKLKRSDWAPLNFDTIFEFLGQFTMRCILLFKKVLIILR